MGKLTVAGDTEGMIERCSKKAQTLAETLYGDGPNPIMSLFKLTLTINTCYEADCMINGIFYQPKVLGLRKL